MMQNTMIADIRQATVRKEGGRWTPLALAGLATCTSRGLGPILPAPSPLEPCLPGSRRRFRLGGIITGTLVLGFIVALVVVLGPLGGAPDHVITAGFLLVFALGWAALAWLSLEWTDQPQRWAAVPAVAMAVAGLGLLAWPGGVEHPAIVWGLPLATLALAVWMVGQARRHLKSRASWLVHAVFAFLGLAAFAGLTEAALEARDRRAIPMPGSLVDVGGRRLHLRSWGEGGPTVVLISGFGDLSSEWGWIAPEVAHDTRVCAFDLAGRGWSDSSPAPQDGVAIASDLHSLLERASIPGPYVLVGHSLGGLYAQVFAARYPADVAGMVLLDSTHPGMFTRLATYPPTYEIYRRVSATFPILARLGVGRVAYRANFDSLPAPAQGEERALWSTARLARSQRDEWAMVRVVMDQAGALQSLGDRPLIVVTAVRESQDGWLPLQNELAALSGNSVHRILPRATHGSIILERADAASSIRAIRDVVHAVRSGQSLARP